MDHDFDQTIDQFKAFLSKQGWPDRIVWVTKDDVLVSPGPIFVRTQQALRNTELVRRRFEESAHRPGGILLAALSSSENTTFCYFWIPGDEREAALHMTPSGGGAKFSAPVPGSERAIVEVTSGFRWMWLKFKYRKLQRFKASLLS